MSGRIRKAVLSELRFPAAGPSLVGLVLLMPLLWLFTRHDASHVSGVGGLAGEMLVAGGTLTLAVLAIIVPLLLIVRQDSALAGLYPWMVLAIVAGNVVLWPVGYWNRAAERHDLHWMLAPWLAWTSVVALAPACVGQILHWVRARRR